ncbi:MAG: tRNA lysidine(34) synthetase TilS [Desulfobacterales bacterium]
MIDSRDKVLIGVSGGPDSICLWHALMALADQLNIRIGVAHLNHGLRGPASDEDAGFVRETAKHYNTPFFYQKVNIRDLANKYKRSLEEAGRMARYDFFQETAAAHGFDKIALGHHRDDNAEQVLMNVLRGAGLDGLAGIPPARDQIIRPLIRVCRQDILAYLAENRVAYVTDQTNADPLFLRNKIRHHLMPYLKKEFNPNLPDSLNRLSKICRSETDWLKELAIQALNQASIYQDKTELALSISSLKGGHRAHLRRMMRAGIKTVKGDLRRIRMAQIDAAVDLIYNASEMAWSDLSDRIRVEKKGDQLIIRQVSGNLRTDRPGPPMPAYQYHIQATDLPLDLWIPEIQKRITISAPYEADGLNIDDPAPAVAVFDLDRLRFPLIIRNPGPGDRFVPLGMRGSQKLKDYFINSKVPQPDRRFYPVLATEHKIIWLAGHRIAEAAKVTPASKRLVKAELKAG